MSDGYVDLQVNGYAGIDFNSDDLTPAQWHQACEALVDDGVAGILATLITAPVDQMAARLKNIVKARASDELVRRVVCGIHLEGPFISEAHGYVGAHHSAWTADASVDVADRLLDLGEGLVRLWTLSPERDETFAVIRHLADRGVIVSAGHSDASMEQLRGAIDAGLSMFTHLGNGCPALLPRHDNIVNRVLSLSDQIHVSFIADGVHVPYSALGNYMQCVGMDRVIVITDAISAAGLGPGEYTLGDRTVVVGEDLAGRYLDEDDHLAGSAITMKQSEVNLRAGLGLSESDLARVLQKNARHLLEDE